jgi:UDP-2,3-diacylglucosamine pyrophosphatase LpxH
MVEPDDRKMISDLLKELDNIRPILDAPSWVIMVKNKSENEAVRQLIENAWERCVNDFFKIPFIKEQDVPFWPDTIDLLQVGLHLSSRTSKKLLEKVSELKESFLPSKIEGDYHAMAFAEPKVRSGEADFVLYGHTHDQLIVPMDQVPAQTGSVQDKVYFNTGTWRKTWNKVLFDPANREFIGWNVLTYVAVFRPDENGPYNFEVWNGTLG